MGSEQTDVYDKRFEEVVSTYHDPHHLMYKKMRRVLELVKPGRALIDVGCGIGEFIVQLRDRFDTVVGIDISPPEIEFARKRLGKEKHVSLHCGTLESFRFPAEHFDVCLCLDALEHVPEVFQLLQEIYRILRYQGEFIVTIPNWYDIIVSKLLNLNPLHVNTLTPWQWMALLRKANFKVRSYSAVEFPLIHSGFLSKKIPILGMCILITASK
jgi:2-polyprenyl-3-methyl-5-hydroxy-6-metoxy-1,4-benzoquinol methylase